MFGNLTPEEIENVLKQEIIGHLGCHADDVTYIIPISYAYDGNYIYGHTYEGKKIEMMRKNPKVCFQVDSMRDMANWKSVITWGIFEELPDAEGKTNALQQLNNRTLPVITSKTVQITPQWPFSSEDADSIKGIFYRIGLDKKTGRFESNTDSFGIA
jgi:nitroimidazol reductase NimA-like FMN-containing flavoprotein (pyridoxamine 5'-phosphate oxidase superfamily)